MQPPPNPQRITQLLTGRKPLVSSEQEELYQFVYAELHAIATRFTRGEAAGHTLQPTALVNEAYLKLAKTGNLQVESRRHFYGVAATAMRSILIDHARRRASQRHGGHLNHEPLSDTHIGVEDRAVDLLDLDDALKRLEDLDPRAARIAELRCFGGLDHAEIATSLDVSTRTVERHWTFARAWLTREIE